MSDESKKLARAKLAAIESPIRLGILTSLSLRPASVAEIAKELDVPVEKTRYHLKRLREGGLVVAKGSTRRRGVKEVLYTTDPTKNVISRDDLAQLSPNRFAQAHARLLRLMFREATEAVRANVFGKRSEYGIARFPLSLDEQGWQEALEIHEELLEKLLKARERIRRRLEGGDVKGTSTTAALLFFERVPAPEA